MTAASDVVYEQADLRVGGVDLKVAVAGRDGGPAAPLVFLHGFGSTKEDYTDVACQRVFNRRRFLAYDAPGCGQTCCADLAGISIRGEPAPQGASRRGARNLRVNGRPVRSR